MLVIGLVLTVSCAVVEAPPGGEVDKVPPFLVSVFPDSGSTSLEEISVLRFQFSEKMDRANSFSWLYFFPDQRVRKTKWHGAREAEVFLEAPLPADTLIIVEIAGAMRDAHKVQNKRSRRFPLATSDTIAAGVLAGVLLYEDGPLSNGVVELYSIQPDSVDYTRRPIIRRTVTDEQGAYQFNWLPIPSGPFLVRAFKDDDHNLRPGEKDPQRLLPDTLTVDPETGLATAGILTLYPVNTPGRLLADPFAAPQFQGDVFAWAMAITESDTGYYPKPLARQQEKFGYLYPDSGGIIEEVPPGDSRIIAFVDVNSDSTFSVIPDTLLPQGSTASADTVMWYLEPWVMVENIKLEPGLSARFTLPAWTDSLTSWTKPEPEAVLPDSLESALNDSLQVETPELVPEEK